MLTPLDKGIQKFIHFSYIKVFSFKKENGSTMVDMDYPVYTEIKPQAFDIYLRNFALVSSGKGKFCVENAHGTVNKIRVQAVSIQMFFILQINIFMQLEATVAVAYPQALFSVLHVQLILDILTRYGNLSLLILSHLLEVIPDNLKK